MPGYYPSSERIVASPLPAAPAFLLPLPPFLRARSLCLSLSLSLCLPLALHGISNHILHLNAHARILKIMLIINTDLRQTEALKTKLPSADAEDTNMLKPRSSTLKSYEV